MNTRLAFFALGCAAVAATGCHHRVMYPQTRGSATVTVTTGHVTAGVQPDTLFIRDGDFDASGNFTVNWQAPSSTHFLHVQFDPPDFPCVRSSVASRAFITATGNQAECVLDVKTMKLNYYYKYFVLADAKASEDPGIGHTTGKGAVKFPVGGQEVALFCLDLSNGSPAPCNNGDPPKTSGDANPLKVSPLNNIYFQAASNWSVAVDAGICEQTQISASSQPYCTIRQNATPSTHNYQVTVNGNTTGPFQIQLK
jgi:hypothetical protein